MSEATVESEAGEGLLTIPEAARRLKIDPKTLRKALANGEVKSVKLAGALRVPAAEVERLLAASA
jgi:excisionase family DNA binding protein